MGEINLTAIEEYDEQAKRYEYLHAQQRDLEEALLAPGERLHQPSGSSITVEGTMTGREMSSAFQRAFGVLVGVSSAKTGKVAMDVPLDRAR